MPITREDMQTPALLFDTVNRHGTTYWEARAIILRGTPSDGIVRNPDSYSELHELQAHTFGLTDSGDTNRRTVNYYTEYRDVSAVNVAQAERMYKTLRTVERYLEKTAEQDGYPATFGQYVVRVAKALGMRHIVIRDNATRFASTYDQQKFHPVSLAEGQQIIDHTIDVWIAAQAGSTTAAA